MFLFYGTYAFREKETPIIHAIRKSVVSGRHRFTMVKHQLTHDIFAKALDEHPSWEEFLDDRGKGTTPPEFDAMIEKVFRQVVMDDNIFRMLWMFQRHGCSSATDYMYGVLTLLQ